MRTAPIENPPNPRAALEQTQSSGHLAQRPVIHPANSDEETYFKKAETTDRPWLDVCRTIRLSTSLHLSCRSNVLRILTHQTTQRGSKHDHHWSPEVSRSTSHFITYLTIKNAANATQKLRDGTVLKCSTLITGRGRSYTETKHDSKFSWQKCNKPKRY